MPDIECMDLTTKPLTEAPAMERVTERSGTARYAARQLVIECGRDAYGTIDRWGVFPLTPSRYNGKPCVQFGTPSVAEFGTEAEALAWIAAQEAR